MFHIFCLSWDQIYCKVEIWVNVCLLNYRFLRQRYKFLMQNQSQNPPPEPKYIRRQNLVNTSRTVRKERDSTGNDAAVQRQAPRFDLNRKGKKVYGEREAVLQFY